VTRLRRATNDTFRSLQVRNFRLYFSGQLISQIGNWLTLVAQALLVLKLTDSGVALGMLAAAQFGPVLLLGPFAGLLADRTDKRKLLFVVQCFAMAQSFCLAALAFSGSPPVLAVYAVAVLGGLAMAFDNPARRAFVVELVAEDDIANAVSLNSALMTGSRVVGPALGGLLISTVGFGWCFLVDGLSYFAVLAGLWMIDPAQVRPVALASRAKGQIREGLRYARSVPEIWTPLLMMAVIGTLAFNFQTVMPLFVTRDLGGTTLTFTLLMSVISGGALVGALATARRRSAGIATVSVAAVAFGIGMGLLAMAPNQPIAFVVGLFVGLASISFMTTSTAIVQMVATPTMRGRVLALQTMVFLGSTPIGGPIVGTVSQRFGARYSLAVGAIATVGAGIFGLLKVRRAARRLHPPEEILTTGTEPNLLDAATSGLSRS